MLEKLLLASILTFSFGLFADIGWFERSPETVQSNFPEQIASIVVKNQEKVSTTIDNQQ